MFDISGDWTTKCNGGKDKPPNMVFTERKYEPMGKVIMANVKARSL